MIRKKKRYVKPRKMYVAGRIKEENQLAKKYALKNKREIWKTLAKVTYFRTRAKELAKAPVEEQECFFKKLQALGLKVYSIADVLGLKVEDFLDRRLTTILMNKNLANTAKQARQMVVHKRIIIDGKAISSPSYIVPVSAESSISVKTKEKKPKAEKQGEEKVENAEAKG